MKVNLAILKSCISFTVTGLCGQLGMAQGTIIVGTYYDKDTIPFGVTGGGTAAYIGEYQQIYASSAFSSPILISKIAFSEVNPGSLTAAYNLSIGLGDTTRTPPSPGTNFETGFTTVFSGSLSAVFTPATNDFDLLINLSTPFYYNPEQGNLLLDVVVSSATGDNVVFALDESGSMGRLWTRSGSIVAQPDWGLVTQFTIVPEPSPSWLLFLGSGVLIYVRTRIRRRTGQRRLLLGACGR
jgi:hypothetical protein